MLIASVLLSKMENLNFNHSIIILFLDPFLPILTHTLHYLVDSYDIIYYGILIVCLITFNCVLFNILEARGGKLLDKIGKVIGTAAAGFTLYKHWIDDSGGNNTDTDTDTYTDTNTDKEDKNKKTENNKSTDNNNNNTSNNNNNNTNNNNSTNNNYTNNDNNTNNNTKSN